MITANRNFLNTWFAIHALVTLAAGVMLLVAPGAIPSTVGIDLPAKAQLLAFFLGAAEIAIAFLSFGARNLSDVKALTLIIWTFIVFHAATAAVELYDMALYGSSLVLWANVGVRIAVVLLFTSLMNKAVRPKAR